MSLYVILFVIIGNVKIQFQTKKRRALLKKENSFLLAYFFKASAISFAI